MNNHDDDDDIGFWETPLSAHELRLGFGIVAMYGHASLPAPFVRIILIGNDGTEKSTSWSLDPVPAPLSDFPLSASIRNEIFTWILRHRDHLLAHWKGETSSPELIDALTSESESPTDN